MSALPAEWTELSEAPRVREDRGRVQRRAERRQEQKQERRSRQRWAVASCAALVCSFGLTVGILDVIR
ncbi:MAG TPA: hypothetical protein VEG62_01785 [Acidimicrobiales bacterium]|nr:hypothetical protein [Acidimicrobiales bacterium]